MKCDSIGILAGMFVSGAVSDDPICAMRRSKSKVARGVAVTYIRIIQGIPVLVFLMILFYVIFAKVNINSILVAILAFAINFSAYVSEMIRTGIEAVDKGQIEAARALGFSKAQVFFKVTFPQAAKHFLPVYKGVHLTREDDLNRGLHCHRGSHQDERHNSQPHT